MKRKQIYKGKIVDLGLETVQIDAGQPAATFEIVRHPGGAVVAAINETRQVCLLRQYRHAVAKWLWELPAGKIDNSESPDVTIRRELEEEAGMIAKNWHRLGEIVTSPGVMDEVLYLYLAEDLSATQIDHEMHEYIEIHWTALDEAVDMAMSGKIVDAKTIITLIRAGQYISAR